MSIAYFKQVGANFCYTYYAPVLFCSVLGYREKNLAKWCISVFLKNMTAPYVRAVITRVCIWLRIMSGCMVDNKRRRQNENNPCLIATHIHSGFASIV